MQVTLVQVGRIAFIRPAHLGDQFKEAMTVTTKKRGKSAETGWQLRDIYTPHRLWWLDVDPIANEPAFAFMSGYVARVKATLKAQGHTVTLERRVDYGLPPPDLSHAKLVQFRGKQPQALALMIHNDQGLIVCPTGFGKTFLIREFCHIYPNSIGVITVPSIVNARDIYEAIKDSVPGVGMVGGGKHQVGRITVAVTHSIDWAPAEANWVLVDEAHMAVASLHMKALLRFKRAKMLGFTATDKGRSDGGDGFLEALFGLPLIEVGYEDAVQTGNVVPLTVELLAVRTGPDVGQMNHRGEPMLDDNARKLIGIWSNRDRNEVIARWTRERIAANPGDQILIMVETVDHALRLHQLLPEFALVHGGVTPDRQAALKESGAFLPDLQTLCTAKTLKSHQKAFTTGKLRYAIATKIWSRGVDFKDLNVLIRADGAASIIDSGQIPGRLSRLGSDGKKGSALLVDCADLFTRPLLGRTLKRLKIYRDNGWTFTDESQRLATECGKLHRLRPSAGADQDDLRDHQEGESE